MRGGAIAGRGEVASLRAGLSSGQAPPRFHARFTNRPSRRPSFTRVSRSQPAHIDPLRAPRPDTELQALGLRHQDPA
ncbi:hypothetical protein HMPREF1980_00437 [Actinomyces sp. oral taxon 172 str. F0311]|nr:hypothetical protein HMPREF1980_00437 [Actinomyces sp. oral taxon 172 str. F0311]